MNGNVVESATTMTENALKLSEAASDLGALKVIFGVFLVMILVLFLFVLFNEFSYKRKILNMHESVDQITRYFDNTAQLYLNKARARQLLVGAYKSVAVFIKFEVLKARITSSEEETIRNANSLAAYIMYHFQNSFEGIRTYGGTLSGNLEITNEIVADTIIKYCSLSAEEFNVGDMDRDVDLLIKGYEQQVSLKFSSDNE